MTMNTNFLIKRTAKDALIYLPSMIIPAMLGIAFLRVFTTLLSPKEYGHYSIALSTIGLIKVFSVIWLSSSALRFYSKYKKENQESQFLSSLFYSSWASAALWAAIAVIILFAFFRKMLNPQLVDLLKIAILASVVISVFEIIINLFRSNFEPKKYSIYWSLYVMGKPVIGVALILFGGMKVEGIFWGLFFAPFIMLFFLFHDLHLRSHVRIQLFSSQIIKKFAGYGMPMMTSNLSLWILTLSDRYLVEIFQGSEQVGLYGLGYSIPEKTLQFTFMTLMLAAYPIIIENWEKNDSATTKMLISAMSRYYLLLITPIFVTLVALPKQILLLLAADEFADGAKVIPFIASGLYLLGLSQYVQKGLELKQKSYKIAITSLIAGASNIFMNLLLIPKIGFLGAGISCFFSYIIYFCSAVLFVRKELAWHVPWRSTQNILFASTAMFISQKTLIEIVHSPLLGTICSLVFGLLAFTIVLFASRELTKNELTFLSNLLRKLKTN